MDCMDEGELSDRAMRHPVLPSPPNRLVTKSSTELEESIMLGRSYSRHLIYRILCNTACHYCQCAGGKRSILPWRNSALRGLKLKLECAYSAKLRISPIPIRLACACRNLTSNQRLATQVTAPATKLQTARKSQGIFGVPPAHLS